MRIAALVATGALFAAAAVAAPPGDENGFVRRVTATGTCRHDVAPDRARLSVTAVSIDPDPAASARRATRAYEAARAAIQKLNLAEAQLSTGGIETEPNAAYDGDRPSQKGFRSAVTLEVTTAEVKRVGEIAAAALAAGVSDIGQMAIFLSPALERRERRACLAEAVQDARSNAETLAEAAGGKLGRALTVGAGEPAAPPIARMAAQAMMQTRSATPAPTIEVAPQTVTATVAVTFALTD